MGGGRGEAEEETGGEGGKLWSECKINGKIINKNELCD